MPHHRLGPIGLLEFGDCARVELQFSRRDRVGEVVRLRGADDRRGHIGLRQHPGERDDRRLRPERLARRRSPAARIASSCAEPRPSVTLNGSVRPRTVEALGADAGAGEIAARHRRPRDDGDVLEPAERHHLALFLAIDEIVDSSASRRIRRGPWRGRCRSCGRTATRTSTRRRYRAPCRRARRRSAPPSSPPSASPGRSDGSGRGRRNPCRAASATRRSPPGCACATGRCAFAPGPIAPMTLVAITTSGRLAYSFSARPRISSLAPCE